MNRTLSSLGILACLLFSGCNKAGTPEKRPEPLNPGTITLTRAQQEYVNAGNTFALDITREVFAEAERQDEDFVFSPLSVGYLLGMLENGAAGRTAEEIGKVLGYGKNDVAAVNAFFKSFMEQAGELDKRVLLQLANTIVLNRQFAPLKPGFVKAVGDNYAADVATMDFRDTRTTLSHINGWCSEKTHGMIPQILDDVSRQALTYLMNALYFKGTWSNKFDPDNTRKEDFTKGNGDKVRVDMMNIEGSYSRFPTADFETLSMPYGNGSFQMTFFLPAPGKGVGDVVRALNPEIWAQIMGQAYPALSHVKVPKFETAFRIHLEDVLAGLGMPSAFDSRTADFSAMTDLDCCLSFVLQKAKIKVDEEGSEAAAATIGGVFTSAFPGDPRPLQFHLDRPFLYAITENSTGAILFIGSYGAR